MKTIAAILVLLNFFLLTKSQFCQKPRQMKSFSLATYGKGTWYGHSILTTIDTPLNYNCARGEASSNKTYVQVMCKAKNKDGIVEHIEIAVRMIAPSIFKWTIPDFDYNGMQVSNANFDVSNFESFRNQILKNFVKF